MALPKFVFLAKNYFPLFEDKCSKFRIEYPKEEIDISKEENVERVTKWFQGSGFVFKLINAILQGT